MHKKTISSLSKMKFLRSGQRLVARLTHGLLLAGLGQEVLLAHAAAAEAEAAVVARLLAGEHPEGLGAVVARHGLKKEESGRNVNE